MGVPLVIIHFHGISQYKPSSLGYPHDYLEIPIYGSRFSTPGLFLVDLAPGPEWSSGLCCTPTGDH